LDEHLRSLFPEDEVLRLRHVGHGNALPHWKMEGAVYSVCIRLADSIPLTTLDAWREERAELLARLVKSVDGETRAVRGDGVLAVAGKVEGSCNRGDGVPAVAGESGSSFSIRDGGDAVATGSGRVDSERDGGDAVATAARIRELFSEKVEKYLDAGYGECLLRLPGVVDILTNVIFYRNGEDVRIHAVGIMPNHVHVLFVLSAGIDLSDRLQAWKSASAHRINRQLGRRGVVWQPDYFSRIVRTADEYRRQVSYVSQNDMVYSWKLNGVENESVG